MIYTNSASLDYINISYIALNTKDVYYTSMIFIERLGPVSVFLYICSTRYMFYVHCSMYSVHCLVYSEYYTVHSVHRTITLGSKPTLLQRINNL